MGDEMGVVQLVKHKSWTGRLTPRPIVAQLTIYGPKPPNPSQKAQYNGPTPLLTPVALMGLIFWLAGLYRC